jgi:hypothetical protein
MNAWVFFVNKWCKPITYKLMVVKLHWSWKNLYKKQGGHVEHIDYINKFGQRTNLEKFWFDCLPRLNFKLNIWKLLWCEPVDLASKKPTWIT